MSPLTFDVAGTVGKAALVDHRSLRHLPGTALSRVQCQSNFVCRMTGVFARNLSERLVIQLRETQPVLPVLHALVENPELLAKCNI